MRESRRADLRVRGWRKFVVTSCSKAYTTSLRSGSRKFLNVLGSAQLFGLFTSTDLPISTVDVDVVLVDADSRTGSLLAGGIGAVQRIGLINTAIRVNGSYAFDDDTAQASDGALIFGEVSWTPEDTHNIAYVNGFVGIDEFSSAARGPTAGGPLGRTGILFAARGLGRFGAPLGNGADDSLGAAIGYQMFFDDKRRQLVLELGGRKDTGGGSGCD